MRAQGRVPLSGGGGETGRGNLLGGGALQVRWGAIGTTCSHFLGVPRAQVSMEVVGTKVRSGMTS